MRIRNRRNGKGADLISLIAAICKCRSTVRLCIKLVSGKHQSRKVIYLLHIKRLFEFLSKHSYFS